MKSDRLANVHQGLFSVLALANAARQTRYFGYHIAVFARI
jgi:hypothetical protein